MFTQGCRTVPQPDTLTRAPHPFSLILYLSQARTRARTHTHPNQNTNVKESTHVESLTYANRQLKLKT
jgi:hypothetical protein